MQSKCLHRKIRAGGEKNNIGGASAFALDFPGSLSAKNAGHADIQQSNIRGAASAHLLQHIKRVGEALDRKKQIRMLSGIV